MQSFGQLEYECTSKLVEKNYFIEYFLSLISIAENF